MENDLAKILEARKSIVPERDHNLKSPLNLNELLSRIYLRCCSQAVVVGNSFDSTSLCDRHKAGLVSEIDSDDTHFRSL